MFDRDTEGVRIELRSLTKHYPGQPAPAVDNVTLDIPAGELVVFVGPSGCGKTTTMKMINRLVEPTSGEIRIGGRDVLGLDPDELRRHVGYAIQQVGLFPHQTVAQNIGLVPKLLGWPAAKIAERVEELLALVSLEPSLFRDRYPRQLSGGQQQRVGVARALAADPPVMLMDEPFGATDPITREHLQNEFARLQKQLRKTIIFVTHDFEEAIKLGDRIAILRERSHIAQYDTLRHPRRPRRRLRRELHRPGRHAQAARAAAGGRPAGRLPGARPPAATGGRRRQPPRGAGPHARPRHRPVQLALRRAHLRRPVRGRGFPGRDGERR
ncbi:ABC transporter ATP-binding protein [Nonomuraea rubra]|uniref:ABC transporter ATP-binding protein n=1 Tax=Nonomuraea rubra TaxID=46180 RepID=UPI00360CC3C8